MKYKIKSVARRDLATPALKTEGNPEGKGVNGLLGDWRATEPRDVVAKPQRQVLAELFTSMLVLSASFKYRPVPGGTNYLYWIDGTWSLSLIAPDEWSAQRRNGFAGTCKLQRDMTWTILPSDGLVDGSPVAGAIRQFFTAFAEMLDTDLTLEDILPFHVGRLPYYQRLHASALSRSLRATMGLGQQSSVSCRDWRRQLPRQSRELLAASSPNLVSGS